MYNFIHKYKDQVFLSWQDDLWECWIDVLSECGEWMTTEEVGQYLGGN